MAKVAKVTVSLPADLLARVDQRRSQGGRSRSDVVAELLWRGWQVIEHEAREERYRRAYAEEPDNADEMAWAEMAAAELLGSESERASASARSTRRRRAAG